MIVWQTPELAAEIRNGLEAAGRGETEDRRDWQAG